MVLFLTSKETPVSKATTPKTNDAPAAQAKPKRAKSAARPVDKAKALTKQALVLSLLSRAEGATLYDLLKATGWLPHTTRAMLTILKKKGHALESDKADGIRSYRIKAGEAASE